jgi:hypothetical protein
MTLHETVEALIEAFEDGDRSVLPVLADALADAGRTAEADLIRSLASVTVHGGLVVDADARTYVYHDEGGGELDIDAGSMDEAVEMAETLCREGEWGDEGGEVGVTVTEHDYAGEEIDRRELVVDIEPNHEALIRAACNSTSRGRLCGTDPDAHDWTSEGEGGLRKKGDLS